MALECVDKLKSRQFSTSQDIKESRKLTPDASASEPLPHAVLAAMLAIRV
jgi:hypothetical protein